LHARDHRRVAKGEFEPSVGVTDKIRRRCVAGLPRWPVWRSTKPAGKPRAHRRSSPSSSTKELSAPDLELHRDALLRATVREIFKESTKSGPRGVVEDYRMWANASGLDYPAVTLPV